MRNITEGQSSSTTTKKFESRSISFYFVDWTYIPWDFIRNERTDHLAHKIFKMFVYYGSMLPAFKQHYKATLIKRVQHWTITQNIGT